MNSRKFEDDIKLRRHFSGSRIIKRNFTGLEDKDHSRERRRVQDCFYKLTASGAVHECPQVICRPTILHITNQNPNEVSMLDNSF